MEEYLNEKEQWDWLQARVREYAPWVVAGVALAGAGLWGWKWWQARTEERLLQASAQYEQLVGAFGKNDLATVSTLADKLSSEHPGTGYAEQGQLAAAGLMVESNQLPGALERLQKVMAGTRDPQLALTVRLRIARVQLQQGKPDEALASLAAVQPGAFAARFAEVRGDALSAKGDRDGALKAYREAQAAAEPGAGSSGEDLLGLKINALSRS